jgi:histidinol-phosphate aminotransferase
MGLLDYYRQFEALSQEETSRELRAQADERKRRALERVEPLDLSQTTWPDLPHPDVAAAVTFAARRGLQRYPPARAPELRSELAHRHGVEGTRIAIGNGAAQLMEAAARFLMRPGQELVTPWPSHPLLPLLATRAHGSAVPVRIDSLAASGRWEAGANALLAAVGERTRVVALASPNDPTGELLAVPALRHLLARLPEQVAVLLDEALVDFVSSRPVDACLELLAEHPRLMVFRSFSKAWGLAGVRIGYALGGEGAEEVLGRLEPDLGVSELAQVAALAALRSASGLVAARARALTRERSRLVGGLRERGFEVADGEASFVWARHVRLGAEEMTALLEGAGVLVASGASLGEPAHVRIAVQREAATRRLLGALDRLL